MFKSAFLIGKIIEIVDITIDLFISILLLEL